MRALRSGHVYSFSLGETLIWTVDASTVRFQAAENNLKELMAEVTRAMEKAQEAVAKIAPKTETATAATESTTSPR